MAETFVKAILRRAKNRTLLFHERHFRHFAYIHINKTAGSSIEKALSIPPQHKTALEKREELGERRWSELFSFTIVRNPWDRVVSHYHHRVKTDQTGLGTNPIGFNEWVRLAYGENVPRYYNNPKMFMPQWNWIADESNNVLVAFIGRFESLERDFDAICSRINRRVRLPHLKATGRGPYRAYYNEQSREIVGDWFQIDIQRFGYEF